MITWLQTFFMKHNKWLFSALLIVIIVTFVLTIGNQSFFGSRAGMTQAQRQDYYGYDLNHPADQERIMIHAEISAMLQPELGVQGPMLQQFAFIRIAALGLANELGIANPTTDQVRAYLESLETFKSEETGSFDRAEYTAFRDFIAARVPGGETTLARVLREDFRIARVRDALAGPGYVLPDAVEGEFARAETVWDVQVAYREYDSYRFSAHVSGEELQEFFAADPERFEVPERIRVRAIRFSGEDYLSTIEPPSDSQLQSYFNRYRFRYQPRPTEGEEVAEVTLEDVRDQVLEDFRREHAREKAQQASNLFLRELYEREIERDSQEFRDLMVKYLGFTQQLQPYSRNNPPRQSGIPVEIFRSMWIYTTGDRYYSDLAPTPQGAALLIFDELIPAHVPDLEEIREQVEDAWLAEEHRRRFAEASSNWEARIKEAVSAGTSFEDAAEAAGFTVTRHSEFKGDDLPVELFQYQLAEGLNRLDTGSISPIVVSQRGAAILMVHRKDRPTVDRESEDFIAFLEEELEARRLGNGWSALSAWTDRTLSAISPDAIPGRGR